MATVEEMEADIIELEQNRQASLDKAASAINDTYKQRWLDSAARWEKAIEIKRRLIQAKKNIEAIKNRLNNPGTNVGVPSPNVGGGGGGDSKDSGSNYTPPPVNPTPPTPAPTPPPPPPPPVKVAPIDTIVFDSSILPIDTINDLIFENLSGSEIINIARNDIVNGQKVIYQPIKNLSSLQRQYNPNNILSVQNTSDKYFLNFAIKLDEKTPYEGNGVNGEYVYFDSQTGDIVIEAINLQDDEQIEIQIFTNGTIDEVQL